VSEPEVNPDDPYTPPEAYAPKPVVREKPMGFWEHLEELRGTIVKSVITFIVFTVLIGVFIKQFNQLLLWPLHQGAAHFPGLQVQLVAQSPMEPFTMIIQLCVLGALTLSIPFILFFVAQFVAPALTEREMRAVLPMCLSALLLFLGGAAFGFFALMPNTVRISIELVQAFDLVVMWTVGKYYTTLTYLVIGVGAAFEFPLVIVVLVWIGILTTAFLRKYRRHAIVLIFIMAAIITPTPDPFTQTIFAGPLYLLFELAIIIGSRIEKRRAAALAAS
jgi:sec-independent protein translocase protein TatC